MLHKSVGRFPDKSIHVVADVPPPPANVKQGDVTMTSVRVFWSPPLYHEPYRITNYTVQYKKANTKMQYFDAVNVNSNKTKVIVDNLDLDTKYSMRVLSVNGYGSNPSQPIIVNTRGKWWILMILQNCMAPLPILYGVV